MQRCHGADKLDRPRGDQPSKTEPHSSDEGPVVPAAVRWERARDLLQKKKYLNAQLERFQMSKAKAICDQIEMLFLELSQIDEELPAAEMGRIRDYVEGRQLLLKINLVKKELQSGV